MSDTVQTPEPIDPAAEKSETPAVVEPETDAKAETPSTAEGEIAVENPVEKEPQIAEAVPEKQTQSAVVVR